MFLHRYFNFLTDYYKMLDSFSYKTKETSKERDVSFV